MEDLNKLEKIAEVTISGEKIPTNKNGSKYDSNEVVLKGVIVGKKVTAKSIILTLATTKTAYRRRSNKENQDDTVNFPKIAFIGEESMAMAAEFKKKDKVQIIGEFNAKRKMEDNKVFFTQYIVGKNISFAKSVISETFGVNGTGTFEDENKVALSGKVMKVELPSKGVVKILVRTEQDSRRNNISATVLTRDVKRVMNLVEVGSDIYIVGEIQTEKKEVHDKVMYYENLIATNIGNGE